MNKLKRRLQIRFILIAISAVFILQGLIVGISIFRSYRQMTIRADDIIMKIDKEPDNPEIINSRYFKVRYSFASKSTDIDLSHTSLMTEPLAAKYAKEIIDSKSERGYKDTYRYLVRRTKGGIQITFLSRMYTVEAFWNNAKTLIIVSLVGVFIVLVLLCFISNVVIAPLIKNEKKQREFITSSTHGLKTPLTVINADAQLLESEIGANEWLSDIMKQVAEMTEMTNKLVYLSKIEEESDGMVKIDFPISDIAEEITNSFNALAVKNDIFYEIDIQKNVSYCGDEKACRELMSILLDNAMKYVSNQGKISVNLSGYKGGIIFSVSNTVKGIKAENIGRFTDRFYREASTSHVKGFGIGLSIAKAIANAHKGDLTIELVQEDKIKASAILK